MIVESLSAQQLPDCKGNYHMIRTNESLYYDCQSDARKEVVAMTIGSWLQTEKRLASQSLR